MPCDKYKKRQIVNKGHLHIAGKYFLPRRSVFSSKQIAFNAKSQSEPGTKPIVKTNSATGHSQPGIGGAKPSVDTVVYAIIAGLFVVRLIYATFLSLLPDEAYYWDWSRNLATGYFDHPPMVAWFIALSRGIFGETALGTRFTMCAAALIASAVSYQLLRNYVSGTFACVSWLVLSNCVLLFGLGSMLATPDIPLVLFWALSLWVGYDAVFEAKTRSWLVLGLTVGLGMLSKYTFGLFPISLALFLLTGKERRFWFLRWQPWIAGFIALVVWMPNIIWNSRHHWVSILFQVQHGVDSHAGLHFDLLGDFLGGQIGVLSIAPAILLGIALWKCRRPGGSKVAYLAAFFFVPFCFFLVSSLQKKVEANWTACAYVSGFMIIAIALDQTSGRNHRFFAKFAVGSIIFAAVTTIVILVHAVHPFLPIPIQTDPTAQTAGWGDLSREVEKVRVGLDPRHAIAVCANRYQDAALFAFYLPDHPKTFTLNVGARTDQYSLWPVRKPQPGTKVIFLHSADDPYISTICEHSFSSYALWAKVRFGQAGRKPMKLGVLTGTLK